MGLVRTGPLAPRLSQGGHPGGAAPRRPGAFACRAADSLLGCRAPAAWDARPSDGFQRRARTMRPVCLPLSFAAWCLLALPGGQAAADGEVDVLRERIRQLESLNEA